MKNKKLLIISLISLVLFIILLLNINNISSFDNQINNYITGIQTASLVSISKIIGIIFEPLYIIIFSLLISVIIFFLGKRKQAIFFALTILVSGAILYVLKEIIQRARPENSLISESWNSFPSGHALISLVLAGFIIYYLASKIKSNNKKLIANIFLVILTLIIGFSRIYLNVHWFSDVLASWLLGLFILSGAIAIYKLI